MENKSDCRILVSDELSAVGGRAFPYLWEGVVSCNGNCNGLLGLAAILSQYTKPNPRLLNAELIEQLRADKIDEFRRKNCPHYNSMEESGLNGL